MRYKSVKVDDIPQGMRDLLKSNSVDIQVDGEDQKKITKGLLITGATGTGKTHCLHAIRMVLDTPRYKGGVSKVENWVDFLFELKERMGSSNGLRYTIETITDPQYLFIDDLGAENDTNWGQEMLYLVINRIYNNEGILFVTTNLNEEELIKKYGERIMDRISHICDVVEMPNKNYRE